MTNLGNLLDHLGRFVEAIESYERALQATPSFGMALGNRALSLRTYGVHLYDNLPDYDNYFCRDCRRIVHMRKGSPGFRACPTPGCMRPTGFGVYATASRPRGVAGNPAS